MATGMRSAVRGMLALGGALLLFVVVALWHALPAAAATITVNGIGDSTIAGDGEVTLREAIAAINAGTTADPNITGQNPGAFGSNDTILFPSFVSGTIFLTQANGPLTLMKSVTIDGTGHNVIVDGRCTQNPSGQCTSGGVQVFNVTSGVTAQLTALTIQHGNAGPGSSGGIFNSGTLTVTNCTLSANSAGIGGGIYNINSVTVTSSTLSANSAASAGGGIYNFGGNLTVTNSTFSANSASNGGGIYNQTGSTLTVTNSTFSRNTASFSGGGIANFAATTLTNTIVANSPSGGDLFGIFGGSNNLIDDGTGGLLPANGNLLGTPGTPLNPLLAPLGNYGGPTQTFALLLGSPALDAGAAIGSGPAGPPSNFVPDKDQRGKSRVGSAPDIGAFESQGFALTATSGSPHSTLVTQPFANPLVATLSTPDTGVPLDGLSVTFAAIPGGSGQSATLGTPNPVTTTASGVVQVTATANGIPGSYSVTASGPGATSATFTLTNTQATPVVTTVADGLADATHCIGTNTTCTLRDAITAVNLNAATGTTITFASAAFLANTPTTIKLTSGTLSLSLPTASGTETIDGTGRQVIVDGNCTVGGNGKCTSGGVQVFNVSSGVTAQLTALTIQHGNVGGVGNGGGILNLGTLTVTNSTVAPNSADFGGGIYNFGTLTVTNSTLSGNSARVSFGGGIYNSGSTLTVTNSTFSANSATAGGGGIYNLGGTLTVTSSTFSANSATTGIGGGILNSGTITLTNTIVANSTGRGDLYGSFTGTNNLIGDGSGGLLSANGNLLGTVAIPLNPLLAPLGSYGGPTQTFALLPGSPALNAGAAIGQGPVGNLVLDKDQRGNGRVGVPDIGAFESQGFSLTKVAADDNQSTLITAPFPHPSPLPSPPLKPSSP